MNQAQARDEINHAWINWALRRDEYAGCTCTPEWVGLTKRKGEGWGVSSLHPRDCGMHASPFVLNP